MFHETFLAPSEPFSLEELKPQKRRRFRHPDEPEYDDQGRRRRIHARFRPEGFKESLCEQQNWRCACCGGRLYETPDGKPDYGGPYSATYEHIVPFSEGGSDFWDNLAITHSKCNNERHAVTQPRHPHGKQVNFFNEKGNLVDLSVVVTDEDHNDVYVRLGGREDPVEFRLSRREAGALARLIQDFSIIPSTHLNKLKQLR